MVDHRTNRSISFASMHELRLLLMLLADRNVVEVQDQPKLVKYKDLAGAKREHTFDYLARFRSGRRIAFAVKPTRNFVSSGIRETIACIRRQSLKGFADEAIIISEKEATMARGWNARQIVRSCRLRNESDCLALLDVVKDINGQVDYRDLIRLFPSEGDALTAVWCLLYDGALKLTKPHQRLIDAPWVTIDRQFFAI